MTRDDGHTGTVRIVLAACATAALTLLSACHTTEGFGRDVGELGEGIEETAYDVRE